MERKRKAAILETSLFETPIGKIVQRKKTEALLGRSDPKDPCIQYYNELNDALYNLSHTFWDLGLTIKLIRFAHPDIKSFKMTKVDKGDYLKYHFENYFFRLPKLKDQVLQLINILYQLNFKQDPGLEKKIRRHPKVQQGVMAHLIDYFDEALRNITPLRHRIAHRSDLENQEFAMLSAYSILEYEDEGKDQTIRGLVAQSFIMEQNQATLKEAVIAVLFSLEEDFNEQLSIFSKKNI